MTVEQTPIVGKKEMVAIQRIINRGNRAEVIPVKDGVRIIEVIRKETWRKQDGGLYSGQWNMGRPNNLGDVRE